jgi:hypothetical protein
VTTLRAATSHENVASQRVLLNAGFVEVGPADPSDIGDKQGTWFQRDLVDTSGRERLVGATEVVASVRRLSPLRRGLSPERARDIVWTHTSYELWDLLVRQRGWSSKAYADYLGASMSRALLDEGGQVRVARGRTLSDSGEERTHALHEDGADPGVVVEQRRRVLLPLHRQEQRTPAHRDRVVVAGEGRVEDRLEQTGLAPEGVVDGLDRHPGRRCESSERGARIPILLEEQAARRGDHRRPGARTLLGTEGAGVGPAIRFHLTPVQMYLI